MIMSSLAVLAMGCQDDIVVDEPNVNPTPGAEVQFGASMNDAQSRTVYGDKEGNSSYRVNWVNGDEVRIIATNCDRNNALYKINVEGDKQNWANSLDKIGETGIQWGTAPTANFYSVYPAGQVQDVSVAQRKITMRMPHIQNDYIDPTTCTASADMTGAFMYAQTFNAVNGEKVQLGYKPFATAIRFTLNGPTSNDLTISNNISGEVVISKIVLQAPKDTVIAGNFDVIFPETGENATTEAMPTIKPATVDATGNAYDYVTIYSSYTGESGGGYLTLMKDESIELNAFIIPKPGMKISNDWSLSVILSDGTTFTKKLGGNGEATNNALTLQPGKIHYLPKLPNLVIKNDPESYDPANWMVNIPRNTYLSEISIPGSWNSLNKDFQSDLDITNQYKAGVRAFHIDTRWKGTGDGHWFLGDFFKPDEIKELAIADGSDSKQVRASATGDELGRVMQQSTPTFSSKLGEIVEKVDDQEYMIVFCTFAQDSYEKPDKTWMEAISDACATNTKVFDANKLNQNTVVGDVLGKVIVIINCEKAVAELTLPTESKCLFVNVPMTLTEKNFGVGGWAYPQYPYNIDYLYYVTKKQSGFYFVNTQAQVSSSTTSAIQNKARGYAPTLTQRQEVGNNILNAMKEYYSTYYFAADSYKHNAWAYFGLGGYQISSESASANAVDDSYKAVAKSMNSWMNDNVTAMTSRPTETSQTRYYPVGLVLMNFATDDTDATGKAKSVVNNILQLNNKYQKAYKADWIGKVDTTEPQADNNATNQWGGPSY